MMAFALDMDGTLYHGDRQIEGASDFVNWLREKKIPFRFLTNNSSHSRRFYMERLNRMGFQSTEEEVLTSTIAAARYIKSNYPNKKVFPVCVPDVKVELEDQGINIDENNPDIVLLCFDTTIDYKKINAVYRFLKKGKLLIATHPDRLCPSKDGYDIDIGPFIDMFSEFCDVPPIILGKPDRIMLEMAALEMGVDVEDIVMVGDRLYTDIKMAWNAGTKSIAVLTGEATDEDIKKSPFKPTYICKSVSEISSLSWMNGN